MSAGCRECERARAALVKALKRDRDSERLQADSYERAMSLDMTREERRELHREAWANQSINVTPETLQRIAAKEGVPSGLRALVARFRGDNP